MHGMSILDIWKENADFVLRVCLRYVNDIGVAEDIRQDVFLKIIGSKRLFKKHSSIKTWIYSITFHCCLDYFRKLRRQREINDEILLTGSTSLSDSQTPLWEVNKVSKMTCPISQLFVELYFGEGWGRTEIAKIFGFSLAHVTRKIRDGVQQLKELYSKC